MERDSNSTINLELYKKLYLIRKSELKIQELYHKNEMKTPMHMSMGSEHISAGVCHALSREHQVFTSYRSHGLFLAKTNDVDDFFAELYGKSSSSLKGIGGSMHLSRPDMGVMPTSAIVASYISVAVGASLAIKYKKLNNIVVVFFGDGATDEGTFWESINFACLKKLPIIFVLEDNDYAVHSKKSKRQAYNDLDLIIEQFNIPIYRSATTDVENIYNYTVEAKQQILNNNGPFFMHFSYYRYLEHVGVQQDFNCGYREKQEFDNWRKFDPIALQREKLCSLELKDETDRIESEIRYKIENAIEKSKKSSYANLEEIFI